MQCISSTAPLYFRYVLLCLNVLIQIISSYFWYDFPCTIGKTIIISCLISGTVSAFWSNDSLITSRSYYCQILLLMYLYWYWKNPHVFQFVFCLRYARHYLSSLCKDLHLSSQGPLLTAIVVWGNSLVFHDIDKLTSVFIHIYPPIGNASCILQFILEIYFNLFISKQLRIAFVGGKQRELKSFRSALMMIARSPSLALWSGQ